ncbi:MAG TPA: sugar transferase [Acidimicrobiales bacterium]|nr:sugar transferase [Acidimicrobiales bacterium]
MTSIVSHVPSEPELGDEPLPGPSSTLAVADDIQVVSDVETAQNAGEAQGTGEEGVERQELTPKHVPREQGTSLRRHLAIGDIAALGAAWGAQAFVNRATGLGHEIAFGIVAVIVTLAVMQRSGLYRSRVCALRSLEAVRVVAASAVGTSAFILCDALIERDGVGGPLVAGATAVVLVLTLRWRFSRWLKWRRSASRFLRTVVMVGTNEDAERLWTLLSEEPELGYRIGGIAGRLGPGSQWEELPNCADIDRLGDLAARTGANGVIVVGSALDATDRRKAVDQALAAGLHVQVWPGLDGLSSRRTRMAPVSGVPLLYVEPKETAAWQLAVKRGMDVVLAALLMLLTAPLMIAAAVAIKLTDKGPILYHSDRVGRDRATISVLKFRTMVQNAAQLMVDIEELNERKGGPLFKATDDPRVTKVGRVLRSTSIDELPQLWNVLNGTMSLVGPRPALPHEVEHFDDELQRRHEMRPGITGLWQVEARDNPSFSAYRRLDLHYVDDWSLGLDFAILASTGHEMVVRALRVIGDATGRRNVSSETL